MAQTANFNLEKPDITRDVDEEFYQLQETLDLLDSILTTLQTAVNAKAAATHTHAISDVINLASELASKMPASTTFKLDDLTDVSGADGAPNNYVLVKSALGWLPSSALAALGTHGHLISEITGLVDALAGKSAVGHAHAIVDTTGLQTALDAKANTSDLAAAVPAGAVFSFAQNSAPTGWLKANGAAVSRTTYASLFSAIGTAFGAGNGSTTFNLPDLRGEFLRGWDDGRGIDSGRVFGSAQADGMKSHTHDLNMRSDSSGMNHNVSFANVPGTNSSTTTSVSTAPVGATGGSETRPRNVSLLYCIKF
jgi:phage-related tail fiber protein